MTRCCVLICLVSLLGCGKSGGTAAEDKAANPNPVAKDMGVLAGSVPDWTYKELLDYLKSRGLPVKMSPCRAGQLYILSDDPDESAGVAAEYHNSGAWLYPGIICHKTASAQEAKEAAGHHEKGTWVWGRYYFRGNEDVIGLFRQALTGNKPVEDPNPDLSYDELVKKLQTKGLRVKVRPYGVAKLIVLADTDAKADALLVTFRKAAPVLDIPRICDAKKPSPAELVNLNSSVVCLKRQWSVLVVLDPNDHRSFAWGKFGFYSAGYSDDMNAPLVANAALLKIESALR